VVPGSFLLPCSSPLSRAADIPRRSQRSIEFNCALGWQISYKSFDSTVTLLSSFRASVLPISVGPTKFVDPYGAANDDRNPKADAENP
jgi:hypothetical protein